MGRAQGNPGASHSTPGFRKSYGGNGALLAIIANGLNGAAFHGFRAEGDLLIRHRLLADKGETLVIIAGEEVRSRLTAKVAVDAVAVNIELARNILFGFFVDIGHFVYGGCFSRPSFWTVFAKMQSFFVATRHFSRQNRRMQEQKASKARNLVARIGLWNIIWMGLFSILILAVALIWLCPYSSLPTATGRNAHSTLPWEGGKLRVENVEGYWASSDGNERMMLRTAYYPVAEVTLGESQGSGMLYLHFEDERGRRAGDTITLTYENGQFNSRREMNITAEGSKARVFVETGFVQKSAFELHCCDAGSPLWRIHLSHRPTGDYHVEDLGSVTIPAKLR